MCEISFAGTGVICGNPLSGMQEKYFHYLSEGIFSNFCRKYNLYFPGGNISFRMLSLWVMSVDDVTLQNLLTSFERA